MNKLFFIFITAGLAFSCKEKDTNTSEDITENTSVDSISTQAYLVNDLKSLLMDSLNFYSSEEEIDLQDKKGTYSLFMRNDIDKKIAIIAITDSALFLFQLINDEWIQLESIDFDSYAHSLTIKDLNADERNDLIVYGHPNMHGQSIPFVFLSNKENKLCHRADIKLYNIRYNAEKKLVQSYYEGGPCSIHSKEFHRWKGDSLYLVEGVEIDLSVTNTSYPSTVFYKLKNGKRVDTKRTIDKTGELYNNALWTEAYYD